MKNPNGTVSIWTDERTEKVRALCESGMTASQIAAALDCGVSRNGVIGKPQEQVPGTNSALGPHVTG